ncbi:MAG: adenylate cyclase [Caulobacter sp.]|nr:adenylate cyclase [Caulobacter sp.]
MDRETELKFLITPEAADAILARLDGDGAVRQLDATYYDTADHALRQAGFGLRVRDGDGGRKQTLKSASAGGVFARGEWETAIDGPAPDLAALAATPAAKLLKGAALAPVFVTRVQRTTRLVHRDGAVIEAALDRGELALNGRRAAVCELELELKSGPPAALFALARDLAEHAPLRLSLTSKAERGYALIGEDERRRRPPPALAVDASTGEALQAAGRAALGQMADSSEALRARPAPEGVHQLRVASRRLRALLSTFKPLAVDTAAAQLKAELKWLAGELDAARNLDVFVGEVWRPAAAGAADPPAAADPAGADSATDGMAAFGRALLAAQAAAYVRMEGAVESARFRALLLEAAAWLEAGAWTTSEALAAVRDRPAREFAAHALGRRRRGVLKHGAHLGRLDRAARHHLRIRGKKLRYATEALATLFPEHPKRAERFIDALKALQDGLGALNDLAFTADLAREVALVAGDAEAAFAAGRLTAAGAGREPALLKTAQKAFEAFADARPFWPD